MNLLTGHIYGEKLQLRNYGDIIEFAIPTSINERTLVWVRAGEREWATKSAPNQVSNLSHIYFKNTKIENRISCFIAGVL